MRLPAPLRSLTVGLSSQISPYNECSHPVDRLSSHHSVCNDGMFLAIWVSRLARVTFQSISLTFDRYKFISVLKMRVLEKIMREDCIFSSAFNSCQVLIDGARDFTTHVTASAWVAFPEGTIVN